MRFFFRTKKFKIMMAVLAVVVAGSILVTLISGAVSPVTGIIGAVAQPIEQFIGNISQGIEDFTKKLDSGEKHLLENEHLKEEINELKQQMIDYETYKKENEFYKDYLEIKDNHKDFEFADAGVLSRNADDPYGSFLINRGSIAGISRLDPVITGAGLVGYVIEVYPGYSKVATVMDAALTCGGYDLRTNDIGVVEGTLQEAAQGKTRIKNISKDSAVAIGDMVVTSGGGVFPSGLLIGTIESLHREDYNSSVYGIIKPAVDFNNLGRVMVITRFAGQGKDGAN